ncbi:NUBPL iron-transfer P-loop NTPase [Desulfofundulus australicus DSM 11792]|uniref:NUBPL iron-transfer P-loop NTPase n=1 Tax=Desulfofundulus australicus DSM 11792 TaxID=1121425 RepID=A0A1M4XW10_9FIRM|nr:P-loop NTPase [Desulfofundulus australicus]SHE97681.1 NUBPL iron-transfer P-loop NTPase [Desulfofundulus australicus DSM 11792]
MYCVVAAEPGALEVIATNLQKKFPDWRFETAASPGELFALAGTRPDVVVVSRFLPGDPVEVLRRLPVEFPASHIVLLVGVLNEQAKAYVRQAAKYGLTNVVTGKLPGDRPYTIFAALTRARQDLLEIQEGLEWEEEAPEAGCGDQESIAVACSAQATREVHREVQLNPAGEGHRDALTGCYTRRSLEGAMIKKYYGAGVHTHGPGGRFVLVAANKGGAGKTTVAISLSLVMARAGVPTCLCDFDFGGPNVAVFFDIKNRPGIEKLSGRKYVEHLAKELLVRVENNLVVLPGPMDKTLPYFEPGQLAEVVDFLSRDYLVVGDTPPEFWANKPWLEGLFQRANLVLAVMDQSKFSESETRDYAPKLIMMGVEPSRIRIVCNKFSAKLHSIKKVEAAFNAGFKVKKALPRVVSVIPENWEDFVKEGYRGAVPGLEDPHSPWVKLAEVVAKDLGLPFVSPGKEKKNDRSLFGLFRKGALKIGH